MRYSTWDGRTWRYDARVECTCSCGCLIDSLFFVSNPIISDVCIFSDWLRHQKCIMARHPRPCVYTSYLYSQQTCTLHCISAFQVANMNSEPSLSLTTCAYLHAHLLQYHTPNCRNLAWSLPDIAFVSNELKHCSYTAQYLRPRSSRHDSSRA